MTSVPVLQVRCHLVVPAIRRPTPLFFFEGRSLDPAAPTTARSPCKLGGSQIHQKPTRQLLDTDIQLTSTIHPQTASRKPNVLFLPSTPSGQDDNALDTRQNPPEPNYKLIRASQPSTRTPRNITSYNSPRLVHQLARFTPGRFPAMACSLKLNLVILKSLKTPRPCPPMMHLFRICVGRV